MFPRSTLIGGQRREVRVTLDETPAGRLPSDAAAGGWGARAHRTAACLRAAFRRRNREFLLETGEFLRTAEDVRNVVVGVAERPARLRARRRRRSPTAARSRRNTSSYVERQELSAGGHDRGLQAQRHQRDRRRRARARTASNGLKGSLHSADVQVDDHAQLRRDGRGEIERTAVPHADRGDLGAAC